MFRLIKFLFWVGATVILAYFLTDVRFSGKTFKQNIDDFLRSEPGIHLKMKFKQWVIDPLEELLDETPALQKPSEAISPPSSRKSSEGITDADRNKLKGIIENNTTKGGKR